MLEAALAGGAVAATVAAVVVYYLDDCWTLYACFAADYEERAREHQQNILSTQRWLELEEDEETDAVLRQYLSQDEAAYVWCSGLAQRWREKIPSMVRERYTRTRR